MVAHALGDRDQAGGRGERGGIRWGGPVGDRQHAAVEMEADGRGHRVGVGGVRRHVQLREVVRQLRQPPRHPEQRPDGVR
jgi:hypothetical protein